VKPGWTAGVTRGRLLLSRGIGIEHARAVGGARTLAGAVAALAGSAYGERVRARDDLAVAQRSVADTLLWHLRILAGWLPPAGAGLVRCLTGWFELQNIDARIAALAGDGREPPPFVLGGLGTAWSRVDAARSVEEVADAVAGSTWGPMAGTGPDELSLGLRVHWARNVHGAVPPAAGWAAGAGALLIARELLIGGGRARLARLPQLPGVGEAAVRAASLSELRAALAPEAGWALAGVEDPSELWRAELRWWGRVERDASALLRASTDESVVLAVVALLAADAQRTARALAAAAQGGDPELVELIDAAV
jgi:hypothetical protein